MGKPILVLNGPNLNLLGQREPEIYGHATLEDIQLATERVAKAHGFDIDFRQSNREADLVDWAQWGRENACGLIVNAAGYTHTSVALLDALNAVTVPIVEVHLSNIFKREDFRTHSYVSLAADGVICGLGAQGYELAVLAISGKLATTE
ncbi:MAG: type II 3-dehydroquinate dehydratase [Pseudomonadota bacterium]